MNEWRRAPWECRWSRGELRCLQPFSTISGEGLEEQLCYWHSKVVRGLFDPLDVLPPRRLSAADVVSAEQEELAATLHRLGARDDVVRRALAKKTSGTKG